MKQADSLMQLTRISGVALVLAATHTHAQSPTTRLIGMDECLQLALQHNLDVRIQRINPELAQYTLSGSYGAFDPNLTAGISRSITSQPAGVDAQGRPYGASQNTVDAMNAGVSGRLPTGTRYQLGGPLNETYGITDLPAYLGGGQQVLDRSFGQVGISLTQPLLKSFWIDTPRMTIAINKKALKQSELGFEYQVIQTITAVQIAYFNLMASRENLKVQQKALQLAQQLYEENKKRVEVGVLAPLDEKQAESQVAASQAQVYLAQGTLVAAENTLKNLITDSYTTWQDTDLEPSERLAAPVQVFSRQDSWQRALTLRPDLLQARLDLEKQHINVRYSFNQLFPELDLTGSYAQNGSGKEFTDALGVVRDGSNPIYGYGLTLTIPLSNRTARYNYKMAKAQVQQSLLTLKKLEQTIMVQVDNDIATARTNLERVQSTHEATLYAEAALEAEQKKLENGKSTSFLVLQAQRDITQARSTEIGALTDYNTSIAQLAQDEGSTLERNSINIETR